MYFYDGKLSTFSFLQIYSEETYCDVHNSIFFFICSLFFTQSSNYVYPNIKSIQNAKITTRSTNIKLKVKE